MRRVSGNLNRVFMSVVMLFLQERRDCCLLYKTLRGAATKIDDSGDARMRHHIHHIEHILLDVENKAVLLFEPRTRNSNSKPTIGNCRTEDRNPRFISRRKYAILGSNLRKLATEQVKKLAN